MATNFSFLLPKDTKYYVKRTERTTLQISKPLRALIRKESSIAGLTANDFLRGVLQEREQFYGNMVFTVKKGDVRGR